MPKLESISPIFAVDDLPKSLQFYQRTLGFDLAWSWGAPAAIAAVCRDAVEITLAQRSDTQRQGPSRIYLRVSGVDEYCDRIKAAGAEITVPIGNRAYGMRDFRVADPSGNELDVGEALAGDR